MVLTIVNRDGKKDVHSVHHPVFTARHQPQIVQPKRPFGTVGGWVGGGFRGWHWHWEPPPLLLGFHTRSGVGEILGLLALQRPSCEHWLTTRSYITRRQEDARWSMVWQNTLRQLPLLWTMIDFLMNTTLRLRSPHSINSGEDARRWSYSLMDLPGQGRVPRPN